MGIYPLHWLAIMMWLWFEVAKNGIVNGALIALLAVAFSWVYRTTRVFHVAMGAQILAGGYAAVYVSRAMGSLGASIFAGVFASIAMSLLLLQIHIRLQRRETSNSLRLIASIGLYFMTAGVAAMVFGPNLKRGFMPIGSTRHIGSLLVSSTDMNYLIALLAFGVILLLLLRRPVGQGIAAVGSNRRLYAALGHDALKVSYVVHIAAGILAGVCGALEALRNGVEPYGYLPLVMWAAVAALLGGRSLLLGPIIAGLAFGCLKSVTTQVLSDAWVDTIVFGVLLIVVCFWPRLVLAPATEDERP